MELDPKGLEAAKQARGIDGSTEYIIRAYLANAAGDLLQSEEPKALPDIDEVWRMSREAGDDREFHDWVDAQPDKHWAKYDLSAMRLGYELGKLYGRGYRFVKVQEAD